MYFVCAVFKTLKMKKIEKQSSVTPVRSETPGPLVRYFLRYERHSSFLRTTKKNRHQPSVSPVRSEIPGSQVRYFLRYERYNLYCRTIGKTKTTIRMSLMSSKSPMSSPAKWICLIHTIPRIGHPRQRNGIDFCFCLCCGLRTVDGGHFITSSKVSVSIQRRFHPEVIVITR